MKISELQELVVRLIKKHLKSILIQILSNGQQITESVKQPTRQPTPQQIKPKPETIQQIQRKYIQLQQQFNQFISEPKKSKQNILRQIIPQEEQYQDSTPLPNSKSSSVLQQTANSNRLSNFGLQAALSDPQGNAPSVLQGPDASTFLSKDFSKILKKTDEKLRQRKQQ